MQEMSHSRFSTFQNAALHDKSNIAFEMSSHNILGYDFPPTHNTSNTFDEMLQI